MDTELAVARARLEGLSLGSQPEAPSVGSEEASRAFELEELQQATAGFDESRLIVKVAALDRRSLASRPRRLRHACSG